MRKNACNLCHHTVTSVENRRFCRHIAVTLPSHVTGRAVGFSDSIIKSQRAA
jgi:hypothetical protein